MKYPAKTLPVAPVVFLGCVLTVVAAISTFGQPTQDAQPIMLMAQVDLDETPTANSVPSPTLMVVGDCVWIAEARAFVDANGNGLWDTDEPPLAGVTFHVDDILNHSEYVHASIAISDSSGSAKLSVWLPGCPDVELEVYAVTPSGYVLTTAERLPAKETFDEEPFVFGFKRANALPGMPGAGHP